MSHSLERVSPESIGILSEHVLEFINDLQKNSIEIHSFMLLRYGKVYAEGYYKPYSKNQPHPAFSFSKSLTSTAIGFAEQEGILTLDEKLVDIFKDYLPQEISENLKQCTIKDLLTMSCGHAEEMFRFDCADWVNKFLAHPFVHKPSTKFVYNTAGTNMLAAILKAKTGENLSDYLTSRLFKPLGMEHLKCFVLADGVEFGGAGYKICTEDMAKFTQFILQKGVWNGVRLLQANWFDRCGTSQVDNRGEFNDNPDWQCGYSFQYWQCIYRDGFRADGAFGQFGIVVPSMDVAVVITACTEHTKLILESVWKLLDKMEENALAENYAGEQKLNARLNALTLPNMIGVRYKPTEDLVNLKSYLPQGDCSALNIMIGGAGCYEYFVNRDSLNAKTTELKFEFLENMVKLYSADEDMPRCIDIGTQGDFIYSKNGDKIFAAIGRFVSTDTFEAEIRRMDACSGMRFWFKFDGNTLKIYKATTTVSESPLLVVPSQVCDFITK